MNLPDEATINAAVTTYAAQQAPVLFLVLTSIGDVAYANRYAREVLDANLIGRDIRDIVIDFSGSFDLASLSEQDSAAHLLSLNSGSNMPQSFSCSFRKIDTDRILLTGHLDQSEIVEMQREMLDLNQELNNLTRELHKANAQLEQLNSEKNRFLGMAAHDLRKPIGLVASYCQFLIEETEDSLDEEQFGFLNTINNASGFMKRLVDDFLDVSAIEAGKFNIDLSPVPIERLLENSLAVNRLQAGKKRIELQVQNTVDVPAVRMDGDKIEQVITNIVSNAIEHSAPGGNVVLRVSSDASSMTIAVQDFGPGISPENLHNFFKPFENAGTRKSAGEKSTGLGMTIARKIVDAHRGKIWIDSTVGQGTTVSFHIPLTGEAR